MSNVHASDKKPSQTLQAAVKTQELAVYTLQITANEKVFEPKYRQACTDQIVKTAIEIHTACWMANNIRVESQEDYLLRRKAQQECIRKCYTLLALINIAWKLFHLSGKRVQYWTQLTVDARDLVSAWRNADYKRYAEYR